MMVGSSLVTWEELMKMVYLLKGLIPFSKIGGEMVSHELVENIVTQILRENGSKEDGLFCAVTGQADEAKGV